MSKYPSTICILFSHCKVWGKEFGRHLRCKGKAWDCTDDCKSDHCARCGADMKPLRK